MKYSNVRKIRAQKQRNTMRTLSVSKLATKQLDLKKILAGHIPIELSSLLKNFLDANAENKLFEKVTGKRKRKVGLVGLAKFSAFTTELRIAEVLER